MKSLIRSTKRSTEDCIKQTALVRLYKRLRGDKRLKTSTQIIVYSHESLVTLRYFEQFHQCYLHNIFIEITPSPKMNSLKQSEVTDNYYVGLMLVMISLADIIWPRNLHKFKTKKNVKQLQPFCYNPLFTTEHSKELNTRG